MQQQQPHQRGVYPMSAYGVVPQGRGGRGPNQPNARRSGRAPGGQPIQSRGYVPTSGANRTNSAQQLKLNHQARNAGMQVSQQPQQTNEILTASALASASPEMQKNMIGERLYPLVHQTKPQLADKITGMLLEMDNSELLHLLENPEALQDK